MEKDQLRVAVDDAPSLDLALAKLGTSSSHRVGHSPAASDTSRPSMDAFSHSDDVLEQCEDNDIEEGVTSRNFLCFILLWGSLQLAVICACSSCRST